MGAQPTLLAGNGRLLQLWNLFPNATSSWNNVQGQPLRIEVRRGAALALAVPRGAC